jgi:hypothetical protein
MKGFCGLYGIFINTGDFLAEVIPIGFPGSIEQIDSLRNLSG